MTFLQRFPRSLAFLLPLLLVPAAVPAPAKEPVPWLYKNSDVPQDKEWVFGERFGEPFVTAPLADSGA